MPFPFSEICLYLSRLEDTELRDPPFIYEADKAKQVKDHTTSWFQSHRRAIHELDPEGAAAFLSTLLPEQRTDRVYGLREPRLCRILSRALNLSSVRSKDLLAYKRPDSGDLGSCLERVLACGGPPAAPKVTLEEVDDVLQTLAGSSRFSGPDVTKLPPGSSEIRDRLLGDVFKRLHPNEGKWLVRLILKDFSPVRVNQHLVLRSFHFLLPDLLMFQNNFHAAVRLLKSPLREYPDAPDPRSERLHRHGAAKFLKPSVGVKVGRPQFYKARSIDN